MEPFVRVPYQFPRLTTSAAVKEPGTKDSRQGVRSDSRVGKASRPNWPARSARDALGSTAQSTLRRRA